MKKVKQKNIFLTFLHNSKMVFIALTILVVSISISLAKSLDRTRVADDEIMQLEQEISNLEKKNEGLVELLDFLESDEFVEEQARLKLGLKKEGESVVVLKNSDDILGLNGENNNENNKEITNTQKWWKYFFGRL